MWTVRGLRNGYADAQAGRAYRVAAEGPCAAYAAAYERGKQLAAQGAPLPAEALEPA